MSDIHFVHYVTDQLPTRSDGLPVKAPVDPEATPARTPRPQNSWILFRAQKLRDFKVSDPDFRAPQGIISKVVADLWRNASPETKRIYGDLAEQCRVEHTKKYPKYKFKVRSKGLRLKIKVNKPEPSPPLYFATDPVLPPISPSYSYPSPFSSDPSPSCSSSSSPSSSMFNHNIWTQPQLPSLSASYRRDDGYPLPPLSRPEHYVLHPPVSQTFGDAPESSWSTNWAFEGRRGSETYTETFPTNVNNEEHDFSYFPQHPFHSYNYQEEQQVLREDLIGRVERQRWQAP